MAISVEQRLTGRELISGDKPSCQLSYVVRGTDSEFDAINALKSTAPTIFLGLARQSTRVEAAGYQIWDGVVQYGSGTPSAQGESSYSFSTTGGSAHVTQSLATIARYPAAGSIAPDFRGAIGVAGDNIEGVDITSPQMELSETHILAPEAMTSAYLATLFYLTGTVNNAPFRGFAAGEVLFTGASGQKKGDEAWEVTFTFNVSPNLSDLSIGGISGISKRGWDYLWVLYEDQIDADATALVKRPKAVYVEQVYRMTNFSSLGIG